MTDFRDLSRLPVDPSYWDDLEARIMADLGPRVQQGIAPGPAWWAPLASRAGALCALAFAASLAALLLVPARPPEPAVISTGFLRLPQDERTTTFV
ncbi:MAG: hypothetical protein ACRENP_26660, partial [Longimicrobiales bacterium]